MPFYHPLATECPRVSATWLELKNSSKSTCNTTVHLGKDVLQHGRSSSSLRWSMYRWQGGIHHPFHHLHPSMCPLIMNRARHQILACQAPRTFWKPLQTSPQALE